MIKIVTTAYNKEDIDDVEEFINHLFNGLKRYEKTNKAFKFKMTWDSDVVEIKVIDLGIHAN